MRLTPFNRHLLVDPVLEEDTDQPAILLPEEYKPRPAFSRVKVLAKSEDCSISESLKVGNQVICNSSMIEEMIIDGVTYYLLLENYVVCMVEEV